MWFAVLAALALRSGTPDALCPPEAELRAAIEARIGQIDGDFVLDYSLQRGPDGRRLLDVRLLKGEAEVLHRELAIDDESCRDAALTLAAVLERYFDGVGAPAPPPTVTEQERTAPPPPPPPARSPRAAPIGSPLRPSTRDSTERWLLAGGARFSSVWGIAPMAEATLLPTGWERFDWSVGVGAQLAYYFTESSEVVRQQAVTTSTHLQVGGVVPLYRETSWGSVRLAPLFQVSLQRSSGATLVASQSRSRAAIGIGGAAGFARGVGERVSFQVEGAAGVQPRDLTTRFVLRRPDGTASEVAALAPWFAQATLTIGVRL